MNESQLAEYSRHLNKIHIINVGISEHLYGSVVYLLKHSEKYGIELPKKDELERILFNTKPLLESYNNALADLEQTKTLFNADQPTGNSYKNNLEGNNTKK